jgi:tetratricopeptide (TPR) repeat protein
MRIGDAPTSHEAAIQLAGVLFGQEDLDGAKRIAEVVINQDSKWTADAWLILCDVFMAQGNLADAVVAHRKAAELAGPALDQKLQLSEGTLAGARGDVDAARAALGSAAEATDPAVAGLAQYQLGSLLTEAGEIGAAKRAYATSIEIGSDIPRHLSMLALAELLNAEDEQEGLALYERLAAEPVKCEHVQIAAFNLGVIYFDRTLDDSARPLLETAAVGVSNEVAARASYLLAAIDERTDALGAARQRLVRLCDSEIDDVREAARASLAEMLIKAGELERVESLLQPILNAAGEEIRDSARTSYGELLIKRGQDENARRWLLDAADSNKDTISGRANLLLGDLYERKGARVDAAAAFERALRCGDPDISERAAEALSRVA